MTKGELTYVPIEGGIVDPDVYRHFIKIINLLFL